MLRRPMGFTWTLAVSIAGSIHASTLHAQEPDKGVTVALAFSTQYPDRFQEGCDDPAAAVPSIRAHHRILGVLSAELAVAGFLQIPPGVSSACGDAVPLTDGDVRRYYDAPRGRVSLTGEARIIVTPVTSADGTLRLIGGAAWYPARRSPAWVLGAGYRPPASWGALVLDVERWSVGVDYDLERFRSGAPREPVGEGREWQGFWQIRVGLTVWSR